MESKRRLGQGELLGEFASSLCRHDRLPVVVGERMPPGQVGVGADKLRTGRLRLEEVDCLDEHRLPSCVAEPMEHEAQMSEDAARTQRFFPVAVEGERLLERFLCLLQPAVLLSSFCPALEQRGALGMIRGGELERPGQVLLGSFDIEPERALASQSEVADRSVLELLRVGSSGGAGELERLQVVVGEDVSEVLDAFARLALDPLRGCTVALGAGGARDLGVADVPHEDVPEAVLGLALDRGGASRPNELLAGELVQSELDLARVALSHLGDGARPEDLAKNCGVLEQALPLRRRACRGGRR